MLRSGRPLGFARYHQPGRHTIPQRPSELLHRPVSVGDHLQRTRGIQAGEATDDQYRCCSRVSGRTHCGAVPGGGFGTSTPDRVDCADGGCTRSARRDADHSRTDGACAHASFDVRHLFLCEHVGQGAGQRVTDGKGVTYGKGVTDGRGVADIERVTDNHGVTDVVVRYICAKRLVPSLQSYIFCCSPIY
ncbi:hypothetical protein BD626DRAFT_247893 [Schizophyllum amplum]|uniref:Uncharacterized protein n=1 Tax=Schizophyllum amplum TaxID=97359 RepID=A0A550BVG3_9AGAR|nr:hypothetical protein BD626DRAFT_247893 [Auriculariopsis ampla]